MKDLDKEWREYLWETYEITPETKFMNISEMDTMLQMRIELGREYKPISYIEYVESIYKNGLIPRYINKLKIQ